MRLANRHIVRIAAALAVAGATTSAFAQNGEYRRGYDGGYTVAQYDYGDAPRRWGRVHIEDAVYGARGEMCDARRAVHYALERNRGVVTASNQLCGDPFPNVEKRLRVIYRCGDSEPARVVVREHESVRLSCRR